MSATIRTWSPSSALLSRCHFTCPWPDADPHWLIQTHPSISQSIVRFQICREHLRSGLNCQCDFPKLPVPSLNSSLEKSFIIVKFKVDLLTAPTVGTHHRISDQGFRKTGNTDEKKISTRRLVFSINRKFSFSHD